jgi:RNA polymerase sigma-70 factor (ECF subfamily)
LSAFFDDSKELVYSLALRILGDEAEAEEVRLDVYIQVWRTAGAYDCSRGSVTAWLAMLARSRALDSWRSCSGRLQKELPLPEQFDPAEGSDPVRRS